MFFNYLHILRWVVIGTNNELSGDRKLLSSQAQSLFSDFKANAVNLDQDASWEDGSNTALS